MKMILSRDSSRNLYREYMLFLIEIPQNNIREFSFKISAKVSLRCPITLASLTYFSQTISMIKFLQFSAYFYEIVTQQHNTIQVSGSVLGTQVGRSVSDLYEYIVGSVRRSLKSFP